LVELIVVMMLIGIVAGIVAPLLRPEKFQLDAAVVVVASTLTAQQRNSVMRQHNIVIAVDSAAGWLRVHYDLDNDGTIDAGEQTQVVELDEGVTFGRAATPARPLSGQTVSLVASQDGLPALTFRRNGSASEEAIVYVTSVRAGTTPTYVEDARAIEIERATGRVRCYSYNSQAWLQTC
jgi:type II secretory pathway pseudopilin PulG